MSDGVAYLVRKDLREDVNGLWGTTIRPGGERRELVGKHVIDGAGTPHATKRWMTKSDIDQLRDRDLIDAATARRQRIRVLR